MTYAFLALALAQLGALVTVAVWYHAATSRADATRDLLDQERKVSAEYEHQRDAATVSEAAVRTQLEQERTLRAIAETQRNEAQRKAHDLLREHMRSATDDEIRETVADLFASPIALVPRLSSETPKRSESGPDALLRPGSEL